MELSEEQFRALYAWIDAIPLSRPKRNIARDFSDGVLLAEVVAAYFPQLVEIHNYPPANSVKQKVYNLETLNARVLKKLGFSIPRNVIEDIVNCKPGAVENVLNTLQYKMAKYREKKAAQAQFGGPLRGGESLSPSEQYKDDFDDDNSNVQPAPTSSHNRARPAQGGYAQPPAQPTKSSVDHDILIEKEQQIRELQETVEILELKIAKLEQLVRLKDNKIQKLMMVKNSN